MMKVNLIRRLIELGFNEIQFRIGHRTIAKKDVEWEESDVKELSLDEWKDLKDQVLSAAAGKVLNQQGAYRGIANVVGRRMLFTIIENDLGMKAYFRIIPDRKVIPSIQFQSYFESLRGSSGIHLICGRNRSVKSQLLSDLVEQMKVDSPQLSGVHADASSLEFLTTDTVVHLGAESKKYSATHAIYDGLHHVIVDLNESSNIKKWIEFCEGGNWVAMTIASHSLENALDQIYAETSAEPLLWKRFCQQIKTAIQLHPVENKDHVVFEAMVVNAEMKNRLTAQFPNGGFVQMGLDELKEKSPQLNGAFMGLNQSLVQALIKRQVDVSTAFKMTNDPEQLDQMLKKMGL